MNYIVKYILQLIVLVLLQVLIIDRIQLGELSQYMTPFVYIIFVLILPHNIPQWALFLVGFSMGILVDAFNGTIGMHASGLVLICYIRPFLLKLLAPREGFDTTKNPSIISMGRNRFFTYVLISSTIFHLWFFTVEILRFSDYHITLLKGITSAVTATVLILILQYLTEKK